MKRLRRWISAVLSLAMVLSLMAVPASAEGLTGERAARTGQVVYMNKDSGDDANDGQSSEKAVKTLDKAYQLLCAAEGGIGTDPGAQAVIVLCSNVELKGANFNIPKSGKATCTHVGTLTITGSWGGTDYGTSIANRDSEIRYFQLGGPTVLENLTLDAGSQGLTLYVGENFTMAETVKTQRSGNNSAVYICGGWCRVPASDKSSITILGGTVDGVSPITRAQSHAASTGDCDITVGGSAHVLTLTAGTLIKKNTTPSNGNVTVTVSGGAVVDAYHPGGVANGTVTSSTLVMAGGTVQSVVRTGKVISANIVLSGHSGPYAIPDGPWDTLTVTNNSNVIMENALTDVTNLVVDTGSTVTLSEGDKHEHTGGGAVTEVPVACVHDWQKTGEEPATCIKEGTVTYACSKCGETKTETTGFVPHSFGAGGVCAVCGVEAGVVYVRDGGTGSGFTADSAVGSLEEAYRVLLANSGVGEDAGAEAVIVICGDFTVKEHFNQDMALSHKGTVTYTSVCGGTDYRSTANAKLILNKTKKGDEHRFQLGGPTVMKDLVIDRVGKNSQSVTILVPSSLVMEETVETRNTNWSGSYVPPQPGLTDAQIGSIALSAHRGYQPCGPENSLPSFTAAGQRGFAYIETDVYRTTDGELVCIHDAKVDRTYNGTGKVIEKSLAELQALRMDVVKYGCPDIFTFDDAQLVIPMFRQYLEICKQYGCKPFIELKDYREGVTKQVIDTALEYFDAKDIVISSSNRDELVLAHNYNKDLFQHLIWGTKTDEGYTESIQVLSEMKNSAGETWAGIAFDVSGLDQAENYARAESWIKKAHDAGLKTCLRAADDMIQVRLMYQLGIDYYPTNTTSPEKLQQLKTPAEAGWSYSEASGGKIFIRGGCRKQAVSSDISITLLGGMYDMVAPSNDACVTTGHYSVTVGGRAFVSRLVAGETAANAAGKNSSSSDVTVDGEAVVHNLYLAGDTANTSNVTVTINSGRVVSISERRDGKTGTADDLTLNLARPSLLPEALRTADAAILTGSKSVHIAGDGSLSGNVDFSGWNVTIESGSTVTANGEWHADSLTVEAGGILYLDSAYVSAVPPYSGAGQVILNLPAPPVTPPVILPVNPGGSGGDYSGSSKPALPSAGFRDTAGHWAEEAIDFVAAWKLFSGYPDGSFRPDGTMTRAMLAQVLSKLADSTVHSLSGIFTDVPDDAWYADAVYWAAERGIVTGYGDGTFGPDAPITREQLAVMLWRYAGCPKAAADLTVFPDSGSVSAWAKEALAWAWEEQIIMGSANGLLEPGGLATRAQVAAMLQRYML